MPRASLSFIAFYLGLFLALGLYMPFWPVFLEHRGLSGSEIGLLLALGTWAKVVGNPVIGGWADRSHRPRRVLTALAAVALLASLLFHVVEGFWGLLAVNLIVFPAFQAMIPLGDSRVLAAGPKLGLDYGRVRLWGSFAFMVATLGLGEALDMFSPEIVVWSLCGALALLFATTFALPGGPTPSTPRGGGRFKALLKQRRFVLFLAVGALLQSSHAVYYGFSAIYWKAEGLTPLTIGLLWAEGVIAEILLFWWGARALRGAGPTGLLLIAAAGGMVRWAVLGASADLPVLILVQGLHAASFGAAHLGAMHFITREAPADAQGSAQGLYTAATGGVGMGLIMLAAGPLYEAWGGHAFHAMMGLSALAAGLGLCLAYAPRFRPTPAESAL